MVQKPEALFGTTWMATYTEDCEEDVDAEISAASPLKEDSKRREDDGEDDLADVAARCQCACRDLMLGGTYLAVKAIAKIVRSRF